MLDNISNLLSEPRYIGLQVTRQTCA